MDGKDNSLIQQCALIVALVGVLGTLAEQSPAQAPGREGSVSGAGEGYAPMCRSPSSRDPSWSPDGERIFFTSNRTGNQEVWSMRADGSDVHQVTRTGVNLYYPAVSPDGDMVVFTAIDSLGQRVAIARASGGKMRYLTDVTDQAADATWLSDGRLIYSSARGGERDLWISDGSGHGLRMFALDGDEWAPRISPSGERILFATDRDGNGEVYTVALDGSDLRNLSRADSTWDGVPTWSPSGRQVAYYSRVPPDTTGPTAARRSWATAELMIRDVDGTTTRQLTSNRHRDQSPSWSPDGQRLAFASCASGNLEIWTIDPDGGNPLRLTRTIDEADSVAVTAVVGAYVNGWRDGDVGRLATVLAPEGVLLWMSDDALQTSTFGEALASRRPSPGYGEPWDIRSVRIVDGRIATVEVLIADQNRFVEYTDLLTLQRFEDGWRIVTKVSSVRRD